MNVTMQTLVLKEKITNAINESQLPSINVLYVLESFQREVNDYITKEVNDYHSKKKEGDSDGNNECNDTNA